MRSPTKGVNWHRVLWITTFFLILYTTGFTDACRPLPPCNPLLLETCEP